jgi:hypothetical protein
MIRSSDTEALLRALYVLHVNPAISSLCPTLARSAAEDLLKDLIEAQLRYNQARCLHPLTIERPLVREGRGAWTTWCKVCRKFLVERAT